MKRKRDIFTSGSSHSMYLSCIFFRKPLDHLLCPNKGVSQVRRRYGVQEQGLQQNKRERHYWDDEKGRFKSTAMKYAWRGQDMWSSRTFTLCWREQGCCVVILGNNPSVLTHSMDVQSMIQPFCSWVYVFVYTCTPCFIVLHFIVLCRYYVCLLLLHFFFLNELKVYGNHMLGKSIGYIFLTVLTHFMSLCHSISSFFYYFICFDDL